MIGAVGFFVVLTEQVFQGRSSRQFKFLVKSGYLHAVGYLQSAGHHQFPGPAELYHA